jgi:glutaredoxin
MTEKYPDFMVFKLKNNGERIQLDITEQEFSNTNGKGILQDSEVIIIIKESIRRIYIWKGISSSVRKKFIGSRVAATLQKELTQSARFHRCKVVSIDQGDELKEFLNHFHLNSIKTPRVPQEAKQDQEIYKYDPKTEPLSFSYGMDLSGPLIKERKSAKVHRTMGKTIQKSINMEEPKKLLNKILDKDAPKDYQRRYILIGTTLLYGIVKRKSQLFGNQIDEEVWEPFKNFDKDLLEMNDLHLRVHIDRDLNYIKAIEVLESISKPYQREKAIKQKKERETKEKTNEKAKPQPKEKEEKEDKKDNQKAEKEEKKEQRSVPYLFSKWTVNNLRNYCKKNDLEIPSGSKKGDIIQLIKDHHSL